MKKFIKYQLEIKGRTVDEDDFTKWNWESFDKSYPSYFGVTDLAVHTERNSPIFVGVIRADTSAMCNGILKELKAKLKMNFCHKGNKVVELLVMKGNLI